MGGTCLHPSYSESGCSSVGQGRFIYSELPTCIFLVSSQNLEFSIEEGSQRSARGIVSGGILTLPYDPFSASFHTRRVSPAVPFLALHTKQGCLIIPYDRCKNAWIHGSPTAENLF